MIFTTPRHKSKVGNKTNGYVTCTEPAFVHLTYKKETSQHKNGGGLYIGINYVHCCSKVVAILGYIELNTDHTIQLLV